MNSKTFLTNKLSWNSRRKVISGWRHSSSILIDLLNCVHFFVFKILTTKKIYGKTQKQTRELVTKGELRQTKSRIRILQIHSIEFKNSTACVFFLLISIRISSLFIYIIISFLLIWYKTAKTKNNTNILVWLLRWTVSQSIDQIDSGF